MLQEPGEFSEWSAPGHEEVQAAALARQVLTLANHPPPQAQCSECGGEFCRADGGLDPVPTAEPTALYAPTVMPSEDPFDALNELNDTEVMGSSGESWERSYPPHSARDRDGE